MRHLPPHAVSGRLTAAPAHAARPVPPHTRRLAALAVAVLIAIGLGIAAQKSSGGPARSTPSSAQYMKDDGISSSVAPR